MYSQLAGLWTEATFWSVLLPTTPPGTRDWRDSIHLRYPSMERVLTIYKRLELLMASESQNRPAFDHRDRQGAHINKLAVREVEESNGAA